MVFILVASWSSIMVVSFEMLCPVTREGNHTLVETNSVLVPAYADFPIPICKRVFSFQLHTESLVMSSVASVQKWGIQGLKQTISKFNTILGQLVCHNQSKQCHLGLAISSSLSVSRLYGSITRSVISILQLCYLLYFPATFRVQASLYKKVL